MAPHAVRLNAKAVPTTIVIGPAEHLPALQALGAVGQTGAFDDTDALGALDAITDERPDIVLIERSFADTSRGAALIKRIKADPTLTACDIRVVASNGRGGPGDSTSSPGLERGVSGIPANTALPAATASNTVSDTGPTTVPTTAPATKLDQRGTRRAPRMVMSEGIDVQVDGNPATLIDLSQVGAQVVSPTSLKPQQRVRFTLPDPNTVPRGGGLGGL